MTYILPERKPFWLAQDQSSRAVFGIDPSRVRVPESMQGAGVEMSATSVVMIVSFGLLLSVLMVTLSKLKTERRAQSGLQQALDAMSEVLKNANEQTQIAQRVNTQAEVRFKTAFDAQTLAFEKAFTAQRESYKGVIDAQAARIISLTDHLIGAGTAADERVADAQERDAARFERERVEWREALARAGDRARAAANALGAVPSG